MKVRTLGELYDRIQYRITRLDTVKRMCLNHNYDNLIRQEEEVIHALTTEFFQRLHRLPILVGLKDANPFALLSGTSCWSLTF